MKGKILAIVLGLTICTSIFGIQVTNNTPYTIVIATALREKSGNNSVYDSQAINPNTTQEVNILKISSGNIFTSDGFLIGFQNNTQLFLIKAFPVAPIYITETEKSTILIRANKKTLGEVQIPEDVKLKKTAVPIKEEKPVDPKVKVKQDEIVDESKKKKLSTSEDETKDTTKKSSSDEKLDKSDEESDEEDTPDITSKTEDEKHESQTEPKDSDDSDKPKLKTGFFTKKKIFIFSGITAITGFLVWNKYKQLQKTNPKSR